MSKNLSLKVSNDSGHGPREEKHVLLSRVHRFPRASYFLGAWVQFPRGTQAPSLRDKCIKGEGEEREKSAEGTQSSQFPSLFPFLPIPYPFQRLLRRL